MTCQVVQAKCPPPHKVNNSLVEQMKRLKPDEAIVYLGGPGYRSLYNGARRNGFKITTRKQKDGTLLVWKVQ